MVDLRLSQLPDDGSDLCRSVLMSSKLCLPTSEFLVLGR